MKTLLFLFRKNDGNVIIMVAVFILLIFAIGGAGVDFGRAQLVQMKEQQASDAAALAAATILDKNTNDPSEDAVRSAAAYRYYNLNFPATYLGVARNTPNYVFDKASGNITVGNTQNVTTNYITTMGRSNLDVGASTKVNIPSKNLPDFDVVMVVDESGSTGESVIEGGPGPSRMTLQKEAINSMIENLFPDNQPPNPNLRLGLIGHSGPIDHAHGLSSDKAQVKSYADAIDVYGETYSHWGLEAGFNMITGIWNGFVAPSKYCCFNSNPHYFLAEKNTGVPAAATDRDDGETLSKVKYLVFINDGDIMKQPLPCYAGIYYKENFPTLYTDDNMPPGEPVPTVEPPNCRNFPKLLEQCTKLKDAGVTVFVINFAEQDLGALDTMTACASTPDKYFFAPDGDTLKGILTGIAKKANKVRITE